MAAASTSPVGTGIKTAANLDECTVRTPAVLVDYCWEVVKRHRPNASELNVVDLGAGDGRFAKKGYFRQYSGFDVTPAPAAILPAGATLHQLCASQVRGAYDICIGNPPYLRHHAIEPCWRDAQRNQIFQEFGFRLNRLANLYLYFIIFALRVTKRDGLIALLVPFDWYSRPSAQPLRSYLERQNVAVDVYRIGDERRYFPEVYTTLSLLVIDCNRPFTGINVHDAEIESNRALPNNPVSKTLLPFTRLNRSGLHAFRGFSPGDQRVFVLTEKERTEWKISRKDVVPCVTSLRPLEKDLVVLTSSSFERTYVRGGERCWLLRTNPPTPRVLAWLDAHVHLTAGNYTCAQREPWYHYNLPPEPDIVYSSAFRNEPKILINSVRARVLGSVQGIKLGEHKLSLRQVRNQLAAYDFSSSVVPLAKGMRKLEVGQMNSILNTLAAQAFPTRRIRPSQRGSLRNPLTGMAPASNSGFAPPTLALNPIIGLRTQPG